MGQFFGTCIANKNDDIVAKTAKIQERARSSESGSYDTRYDVTILVNGLPLVHIELKRRGVQLKEAYDSSFLSELYPGAALSRNTVSKFIEDVGKACSKIVGFMRDRSAKVGMDHHLLIDGTLKSNESTVNTLSDFSRKAKVKGSRDISVLYAFDLDAMEPVCSKCFPGNMLDITSYESFISENKITRGLIVADKGFPANAATVYKAYAERWEIAVVMCYSSPPAALTRLVCTMTTQLWAVSSVTSSPRCSPSGY